MRMYTEKMRVASSFLAAEGSASVSAAGSKGRLQQDITGVDSIPHCFDRMSKVLAPLQARLVLVLCPACVCVCVCVCLSVTNLQFFR